MLRILTYCFRYSKSNNFFKRNFSRFVLNPNCWSDAHQMFPGKVVLKKKDECMCTEWMPPKTVHIVILQFLITTNHQNPLPLLSCLFPFHLFYVFLHLFSSYSPFLLFPFLDVHLPLTHHQCHPELYLPNYPSPKST